VIIVIVVVVNYTFALKIANYIAIRLELRLFISLQECQLEQYAAEATTTGMLVLTLRGETGDGVDQPLHASTADNDPNTDQPPT